MTNTLAKQSVLVTGGSGFIGTHLVAGLIARGAQVVNLDTRRPTLAEHAAYWRQADLMDAAAVKAVMHEVAPSIIYNLAANADISSGAEQLRVNVDGLKNLVEAARELASPPLIIQTSTQLVAGAATESFDPRAFKPYTVYGESKAEAEQYLHGLDATVRWTIVRPTTIWGPYHPTFARQIWRYLKRRYYLHPAGLDVVRSYGYVGNVVHQLLRIPEVPAADVEGKTFYVGDEPVPSTLYLDGFSRAFTGKPVRRVPMIFLRAAALGGEISGRLGGPSPINLGRLYRMTSDYPVPMGPTFEILGRGPYTFEAGVAESVAWFDSQ